MIIVDTSIWIDHIRRADPDLTSLLVAEDVLAHRYVAGELALGRMKSQDELLADFRKLPAAYVASHREVVHLIERQSLAGSGIGYVDAHLVASAIISNVRLWARDKRLAAVAERLGVFAGPTRH